MARFVFLLSSAVPLSSSTFDRGSDRLHLGNAVDSLGAGVFSRHIIYRPQLVMRQKTR